MIGIIGGSGVYDSSILSDVKTHKVHTPYGSPSDVIHVGKFANHDVAFLSRHGKGHVYNPSQVNYRANIFALKSLGVTRILAVSAVGSLQDHIHPGDIVFPDQFIDRTTQRKQTFYEGSQVAHVSLAEPFCPYLRQKLRESAKELGISHFEKGTYVCIEGPRFSTKAESHLFRSWGGHIIGMTLVPEVVLAREAELCYATISLSTDYDSFKEHPVTAEEIVKTMHSNVDKAKRILQDVIPRISRERLCACGSALRSALM